MKKVVIIGGVAGGASCAARLRRLDNDAEIILIERGEYISYANCGLPYHIGNIIKSRDALILQTPDAMRKKFNIDVRINNEVTSINRDQKTVTVTDIKTNESYEETYDTLVISTGSSPVRPPIPGIDSPRVQTLWTIPDTDKIVSIINNNKIKNAAVIGGGFIGIEMAENLRHAGLEVSLIEMLDQVMAPFDYEMSQILHENIVKNNVNLFLGDGVSKFEDDGNSVTITLKSGQTISADIIILAIGVKPNSSLAKTSGLELNSRGGIVVDEYLKTSDPSIYAVGDVIEVEEFISKNRTIVPLAGPANKQGRIAANNIWGSKESYNGTQGTSVAKVFDLTAASTGLNEKILNKNGLVKGTDYESIIITQNSHAGYYPGAKPLTLKLLFSPDGSKIFGAQIIGVDGVDKRIDTLATVIRLNADITQLKTLELAYAPPYSSAKDPVNMAGFVAENLISSLVKFSEWDEIERKPNSIVLDVREASELMAFSLPKAKHIPLGQLRKRISELNPSDDIIVLCAVGVRAYNAARILMLNGFKNVKVYPSGVRFYQATHYKYEDLPVYAAASDNRDISMSSDPILSIDCVGLQCPQPISKLINSIEEINQNEVIELSTSDPGVIHDIEVWCTQTGHKLVSSINNNSIYNVKVMK